MMKHDFRHPDRLFIERQQEILKADEGSSLRTTTTETTSTSTLSSSSSPSTTTTDRRRSRFAKPVPGLLFGARTNHSRARRQQHGEQQRVGMRRPEQHQQEQEQEQEKQYEKVLEIGAIRALNHVYLIPITDSRHQ